MTARSGDPSNCGHKGNFMTGVRNRSTETPVGDAAGDLISGLNDDLLVRILDLLPDTRDAVRTHALSRRWRGLWTGVAALHFDSGYSAPEVFRDAGSTGAAERYLAFVNDALALRAKATRRLYAVNDLAIRFDISGHQRHEPVPPSYKAVQGWIRFAVQNEVKSLIFDMDLPWSYTKHHEIAIDDLATSPKLETLHLRLGYAQLGLFSSVSTVVFASLTVLSLGDIMVAAGLLSVLVSSSCCPRLRKLHLSDLHLSTMEDLLLEADALLELSMGMMYEVQSLELRTPSLRILHVDDFDLKRFKILSAPMLEDLMFLVQRHLHIEDDHGHLSSVATLKIELSSPRGIYNDENDGSFELLKCCRLTRSLEVSLYVVETKRRTGDIIEDRIPPLPHVTSLTLHVTLREPHFYGSGIASFLAQCSSIRYLRLQLCHRIMKDFLKQDHLCENSCQWNSHEFSLAHLKEIEFKNLIGTNCELQFIRSILKKGKVVQKVAISFDPNYRIIKDNKDAFNQLPPLDGGSWTTCNNADLSYKWRRYFV